MFLEKKFGMFFDTLKTQKILFGNPITFDELNVSNHPFPLDNKSAESVESGTVCVSVFDCLNFACESICMQGKTNQCKPIIFKTDN